MTVVVSLGLASICFLGQCHPALVGAATPAGHYRLRQRIVVSPGYGGDVLSFEEGDSTIFAIHRIWLGSPREQRPERLASPQAARRRDVTDGCINVAADVYDKLVDCCADAQLVIE
ncbi:murein L,D-transpeptidase [Rhizorhabdus phycosphaerae]|uniref:murein L,D-transpeptidase n=1 Tax=Rhizorhabdus phycosphaerae TaxID=2711156 RepID=UPI0013EC443B|nr:murein L,D-transpeptidase [Rhizorhabdus phycosphaerae]